MKLKTLNKTKNFCNKLAQKMRITIHPAFFVVVIYCAIFGGLESLLVVSLLAVVHELGHAVVAARFGYKLKKIRLLPFGAEVCGDSLFLPSHEIKIAIAGPITNLVICAFCVALMWIEPNLYGLWQMIFLCSLSLALFNLLPFFPLDGGRVFVAIISKKLPRKTALKIARMSTLAFAVCLLFLFVLSIFIGFNFSIGIMSVFLLCCAIFPSKSATFEHISSASYKQKKMHSGLKQERIMIDQNAGVLVALSKVEARVFAVFVVVNSNFETLFEVSETQLEEFIIKAGTNKKMCDINHKIIDKSSNLC